MMKNVNTQWETILRFMFALDFVKGYWGKRKEFDFSRASKEVLIDLLSNLWRENVFHWCAHCLNETADQQKRCPIPKPINNPCLN